MSSAPLQIKDQFEFRVANFARPKSSVGNQNAGSAIASARQNYISVFHRATHASLKSIISGLIEARRKHDLDDEAFSEIMEIVLAHYIENEVTSKVDHLLANRIGSIISFGLGGKK